MPCMCGSYDCPSCGPAQGVEAPSKCLVCHRFLSIDNLTGTCPAPRECFDILTQRQLKVDQAEFQSYMDENEAIDRDLGLVNPTNQERKAAIRRYVLRSQP